MAEKYPEYSYKTRRQRPAIDPAMRRIAIGAGGIGVAVIAVAMFWSGMRPSFGPPPEITAPATPLRVVPADPGGLTVPGANETIMSGNNAGPAPSLAPAPAAPALAQLQQQSGVTVVTPPAPPPPPPAAAPGAAPVEVQLAATVDQPSAEKKWASLRARMPALVAGKTPEFVPAVVDGETIWRLRLGGFPDQASAAAFCAQVVAQGGECTVPSS